jgi:hypothetical protein
MTFPAITLIARTPDLLTGAVRPVMSDREEHDHG